MTRRVLQLSERGNVKLCVNGAVTLSPGGCALGETAVVVPTLENNHTGDDLELGIDGRYLEGLPRGAGSVKVTVMVHRVLRIMYGSSAR